jgi:hypothetical protein
MTLLGDNLEFSSLTVVRESIDAVHNTKNIPAEMNQH